MFIEKLVKLGLSEKEAMLYLALLRFGPSPVSPLARRVKLKRVTVYTVLDSLYERSLITFKPTPFGRRYLAFDPDCLLYELEKEGAELKLRIELAKECIKKLNSLSRLRCAAFS